MARPTRHSGNLPAETASFVGRRRELAEVRKRLTEGRLVSLVGPGGVGKTRLAVRIATDLRRGFSGGGWLVELAEVGDPALVSQAVMTALDLRDQAAAEPLALLLGYLRDQELLLVVDNCEHLLEAAAQVVTEVMKAAPGVRVIATSREPLSVTGEYVIPVPPLELPAPGAADPLAQAEAVLLFTQRAAAASGGFELTASNQAAVTDLCRRLDGLPLAIELAAVRTRVLSVEQIVARLTDRFALLTGGSRAAQPRHQTLRTTIEWSHDLLPDGERAVLRRLCVFAGRFTIEDVEAVCGSADALGPLSSLVDKSLVLKEEAQGQACYRLHETMREFARLKLDEAGETEALERHCAEYYRSTCLQTAMENRFRLVEWLEWADLEIDNIRWVLRRCVTRADIQAGIDLTACLGWYWITRATTEGIRWLDEFLAAADGAGRGWAYFIRGFLAVLKADPAGARPPLRTAVAIARQSEQRDLLSEALAMAANAENMAGDHEAALRFLDEAEMTVTDLAYPPGRLAVLQARALNGFFEADFETVRSAATQGARLAREAGDLYALEIMLSNLGSVALMAGDLDEAKPLLTEALRMAEQIDDRVAQFYLFDAMAYHAGLCGQAQLAARLFGAAEDAQTRAGAEKIPFLVPAVAGARKGAVAALGESRYRDEFEAGRRLGRDAALRLALGQDEADASVPEAGPLAQREAEVARLVAGGLTNKQIGARLFISERTVDAHVRSILNKLGFSSRSQIAAWITGGS